jgi:predicted nucleotidyltransferase
MATLNDIRAERRSERLQALQEAAAALVAGRRGWEVWLFGSWARGDWDSRSDVDLIAVAPDREEADELADALLSAGLGDDVIALDASQWHDRRHSRDPHWRGIIRDAIRLVPVEAAAPER